MSTLTALARVEAFEAGHAVPLATVRHVHISDEPLVLVPLLLAGEAAAPLAALVGTDRADPELLVVRQPRDRDQRFAFLADLARAVVGYTETRRGETELVEATRNREEWERYLDAPQLILPNLGGIDALRLLGRSSRFRSAQGPYPVDPLIPILGRYLTWFAEDRAPTAGSSVCLALAEVLSEHWATGQSAFEDQHLATLLAWIAPDSVPGAAALTGAQAALLAEDPQLFPSAGPSTDPEFDTKILSPLITALRETEDDPGLQSAATEALRAALLTQLEPTWALMWQGIDLLRAVPEAAHDGHRWMVDRGRFTDFARKLDEGAPPQPRRDTAVVAAKRLADLEAARESYDKQRALDDPLILARYRVTGEAFAGTIVAVDAERQDASGRSPKPRPHVWLRTADTVVLRKGTKVACAQRPGQRPIIVGVTREDGDGEGGGDGAYVVELELVDGMGRKAVPEEGSVPEPGEYRCYSTVLAAERFAPPPLPELDATPWTHGGPPETYVPTSTDHDEGWH